MKLISMTDFVQKSFDKLKTTEIEVISEYNSICRYSVFLKQPLTLQMFVPVDKHGVILEDLKFCCSGSDCGCMGQPVNVGSQEEIDEYYEAKENVLFKSFEVKESIYDETGQSLFIGWEPYNSAIFLKLQGEEWKLDDFKTVEDLLQSGYEIELSDSAIIQIGL